MSTTLHIIQVTDKKLSIIQYMFVPVMITEQFVNFYGTDPARIHQNQIRNLECFIDAKHFSPQDDAIKNCAPLEAIHEEGNCG